MSPSPDPERPDIDETNTRLKEIFRVAAEKSIGPGKPYFERLSNSFNACEDAAKAGDLPGAQRAKLDFMKALEDVQLFAKTDPGTAEVLLEASKAIVAISEKEPVPVRKPGKRWNI